MARYIIKKHKGDGAEEHYGKKQPEYCTQSRRPGIAADWFIKYKSDVFPLDKVVVRNMFPCKPPKYYDYLYDLQEPKKMAIIKGNRKRLAGERVDDNTPDRLADREKCQQAKMQRKVRTYETHGV